MCLGPSCFGIGPFLPRQDSLTVSMTTKGLTNNPGENNCFLNSAIQVRLCTALTLWTNLLTPSLVTATFRFCGISLFSDGAYVTLPDTTVTAMLVFFVPPQLVCVSVCVSPMLMLPHTPMPTNPTGLVQRFQIQWLSLPSPSHPSDCSGQVFSGAVHVTGLHVCPLCVHTLYSAVNLFSYRPKTDFSLDLWMTQQSVL